MWRAGVPRLSKRRANDESKYSMRQHPMFSKTANVPTSAWPSRPRIRLPRSGARVLAKLLPWLTLGTAWLAPDSAPAATLPSGFTESLVAGGLSNPTAMEFAPDGRLFVCEQSGQLRVI